MCVYYFFCFFPFGPSHVVELDVDADGTGSGCWGDDDESINQRMEVWMEVWMAADSHALVSSADFGVLCSLGWRAAQRPWGGFAC